MPGTHYLIGPSALVTHQKFRKVSATWSALRVAALLRKFLLRCTSLKRLHRRLFNCSRELGGAPVIHLVKQVCLVVGVWRGDLRCKMHNAICLCDGLAQRPAIQDVAMETRRSTETSLPNALPVPHAPRAPPGPKPPQTIRRPP